ncbi:MAG: serine hydroxymethyltransferase [Candidatus Aenigmarchaeota archaeon]|nr:serine hydroxymethyltransferase [Candidatus Aenigmarchaeota archaeon]
MKKVPSLENLKKIDPEIFSIHIKEVLKQNQALHMIPSDNIASLAVLEALSIPAQNRYSEGYPGKRYYGGQEFIDELESTAIERAKKLFGAEHVNVQPYSGSPANQAVYFALMELHDTFLGMRLDSGGHLTHGHPVNFSGKHYNAVQYGVKKDDERIDFEQVRKLAKEHKPKIIQTGYTAYPRIIDFKQFREICDDVGAYFFVDMSHFAGLVAGGAYPSPIPYADAVMTTTHKTLRGPRGAIILCKKEFAEKIDKAVFPGLQGGPHEHVIAAKAVCFKEAMEPDFKDYAHQIVKNSKVLEKFLGKEFRLVSGGTDSHLLLLDLQQKITGKQAENALNEAGITANKNTIPFDPRKPFDPSGVRIGTPTLTSRGMKEMEMETVADLIIRVLKNSDNIEIKQDVRKEVIELCKRFPLYPELV